ncbi:MAG: SDR family NAD(P)-dependent oxidoreductase [Campylobacterales bacterium]
MKKTVLITGISSGIGEGIAKHLDKKYNIIGVDIKKSEKYKTYICDLRDSDELFSVVARIKKEHDSLYALINNAGVFNQTPLSEQSLELWESIISLNLRAPYLLSREFADMLTDSKGHIVNIASTRAIMSEEGTEAYSASKGGISSLTHALAISLSHKVSVNSISPGWINTDKDYIPTKEDDKQHPSGRVGRVEDVAQFVEFLLESGFVTGSDFVIDGGMTRKMIYASL